MGTLKVENKKITEYILYLKEEYRPPSRGGNTSALHAHEIEIEGETYSFIACGAQQWIYKRDTVSFEYELNRNYKNIKKETILTLDGKLNVVIRGNRGSKRQLRTAKSRLPALKREQRG